VGVEGSTGKVAWTVRLTRSGARRPLAAGDDVVVTYAEATGPDAGVRIEVRRGLDGWERFHVDLPATEAELLLGVEEGVRVAGALLLVPEPAAGCLRALDRETGRQRFRQCGVYAGSPPVVAGDEVYYLAVDPAARAQEKRGDPWTVIDHPVWVISLATGQAQPVRLAPDRRGGGGAAVRAVRLPLRPAAGGVLHLLQRHLFLTAVRITPEAASGAGPRPARSSP
jgi:hypothetical protein